jgi:hypothetical protein
MSPREAYHTIIDCQIPSFRFASDIVFRIMKAMSSVVRKSRGRRVRFGADQTLSVD